LASGLSDYCKTVPVAAALVLHLPESPPSDTLPSSAHVVSTSATQETSATSLTDQWNAGLVCSEAAAISVDRLERKITLQNKSRLKVTEHIAETYRCTPSFLSLPAILESCKSDDAQLSDASVASGDGYVADGALTRSESYPSNTSSPIASLKSSDRRHLSRCSDEARLSVTSASSCAEQVLHFEGESFAVSALSTTVTSGSRKLSAKSLSDGVDSAVVCTPYSSQTSQDSSSTVDNSSCYRSVSVVIDDQAPQPLPSAAYEMRPVRWENDEVEHAAVSVIADKDVLGESVRKDSDDEMSVKVEWDVESDSEMAKHSEVGTVGAPVIKSSVTLLKRPFPERVSSIRSFDEGSRELERHWCGEPVTRRACCACMSCVIMHQSVSTAADVIPTISVRLCSSVVDVVCLIRRLVVVCSTWLQVLCHSAHYLEHSHHSRVDRYGQDTAIMRSTSEDQAACTMAVVRVAVTGGSVCANLQHLSISEGLEHIQHSLLELLFDVSAVH